VQLAILMLDMMIQKTVDYGRRDLFLELTWCTLQFHMQVLKNLLCMSQCKQTHSSLLGMTQSTRSRLLFSHWPIPFAYTLEARNDHHPHTHSWLSIEVREGNAMRKGQTILMKLHLELPYLCLHLISLYFNPNLCYFAGDI